MKHVSLQSYDTPDRVRHISIAVFEATTINIDISILTMHVNDNDNDNENYLFNIIIIRQYYYI